MANHVAEIAPQTTADGELVQAGAPASAWLWMDVTTGWRARPGQMNGTLRVEQSYAKALRELMAPQLRFCRYHRARQCFLPVEGYPDPSANGAAAARVGLRRDSPLRAIGRRIERALRQCRRVVVDPVIRRILNRTDSSVFAGGGAGQVLLLAGENWGQHDFEVIARLRRQHGIAVAAVCQDLLGIVCPQFYDSARGFVARYRAYADFLIRDVDLVFAISQSTKTDILNYARDHGGVRGRIEVVHLGADLSLQGAVRPVPPGALPDLRPKTYVLSVSNIQPRKNFDLLYRLWHSLATDKVPGVPTLVIVGQRSYGGDELLAQIARDPVTKHKIRILHRARDEELSWLYQNCLWTLYPSFYEGWGLPLSESLAYGKYCLAANSSSLPEAGAGLVQHIDPRDFTAWRDAIVALLGAPERLAPLERAIRDNYRPMTWARSAEILAGELSKLHAAQSAKLKS